MRVPLIALWLRAALANADNRRVGMRNAAGIAFLQTLWVGLLFTPASWRLAGFFVLLAGELIVPAWAYAGSEARWHPHHIAERYGLLTIIVLGESILAVSTAAGATLQAGELSMAVAPTFVGGLLIVYALWWIYFDRPAHHLLTSRRRAFVWGYGHYLIYAAGAAVGAGIAVSVDQVTHHAEIGAVGAGMSVAAPVAVFVMALWFLHARDDDPVSVRALGPIAAAVVLATPFLGEAVLLTGLTLSGVVALKVLRAHRMHVQAG
jgi:low temperature requirement protein LtrA